MSFKREAVKEEEATVVMSTNLAMIRRGYNKSGKEYNAAMMKVEVEKAVRSKRRALVEGAIINSTVNTLLLRSLCHLVYFNIRLHSLRTFHLHLVKV